MGIDATAVAVNIPVFTNMFTMASSNMPITAIPRTTADTSSLLWSNAVAPSIKASAILAPM